MGKVQLYERRSLDSSLVGTPEVSNAGNDIMAIGEEVAQLTQQKIKIENAKIAIADNIEAEKYRIQYENELYKRNEKAKQDNVNNPYAVADTAYEMGLAYADEVASSIGNPRVKEKFLSKAQKSAEQVQDKSREWASRTTAENAFVNTGESLELLTAQAGVIKDTSDLEGLLDSAERLAFNSAGVIGVERAHKLYETAKKSIYENFAYSNIDRNPHSVKALVDSGMFDGVLDEKEQLSLKSSADALARKRELEVQRQNKSARIDTISVLYDKEAQGKLTLAEVNNAIIAFQNSGAGVGEIKSLLAIKKSLLHGNGGGGGKPGKSKYRNKEEATIALTERYLQVFTDVGVKGEVYEDAALSDLSELQNDIVSASSAGLLNKQTAGAMQRAITKGKRTISEKTKEVTTDKGGLLGIGKKTKTVPLGVYNDGYSKINKFAGMNFKNPALQKQVKSMMLTYYVNNYEKAEKLDPTINFADFTIDKFRRKYGK